MSSKPTSWAQWGNKIAASVRPKHVSGTKIGVDIVGYGPIGRELLVKLASLPTKISVVSIADSSGVLYPKDSAQVLDVGKWKALGAENKLADFPGAKIGARGDLLSFVSEASKIVLSLDNQRST